MKAKFLKSRKSQFFTQKNSLTGKITTNCKYTIKIGHLHHVDPKYFKDFKVQGISVYNEEDVFDENLGKRIAECRAKKMVYREVLDQLLAAKKEILNQCAEIDAAIEKHTTLLEREQEHYKDILDKA